MCECCNGGGTHFDSMASRLTCFTSILVQVCLVFFTIPRPFCCHVDLARSSHGSNQCLTNWPWAQLVLGRVTNEDIRVQFPVPGHLSRYVISHPGQLSLATPSWASTMSTSQRAAMPCSWEVKAGMVRVWVAGKTVWSHRYTRPISERFRDKGLIYEALYRFVRLRTKVCRQLTSTASS